MSIAENCHHGEESLAVSISSMRRPWSREPRPVPGWGSLRVVWPLLAAMTWLCKSWTMAQSSGSQQISQADKQPDYQSNLGTMLCKLTANQLTAACSLQRRFCSLLLGSSWTGSLTTRQSGSPACGCWDMSLIRQVLEGCTTHTWLP